MRFLGRFEAPVSLCLISLVLLYGYLTGLGLGWRTTQYFFAYQALGFVRRGLPATLIYPLPALRTPEGISFLYWMCLSGFVLLYLRFFRNCTRNLELPKRFLLLLVSVLSPAFFMRLGYDFGRFDIFGLAWLFAAFAWIDRQRWIFLGLGLAVVILCHEAVVIINLPLVLAYQRQTLRAQNKSGSVIPYLWLILPALTLIAAMNCGIYEPGIQRLSEYFHQDQYYLAARGNHGVDEDALAVITRSLRDNVDYLVATFPTKNPEVHMPLILAWASLQVGFATLFYRRNQLPLDLMFLSAFSPLFLSLIAIDFYRWVALSSINLLAVQLIKCKSQAREHQRSSILHEYDQRSCGLGEREVSCSCDVRMDRITALLLLSSLLGPISNTKSFPFFFTLIAKLLPWELRW